jgi:hypothetical protein
MLTRRHVLDHRRSLQFPQSQVRLRAINEVVFGLDPSIKKRAIDPAR